MLVGAVLEERLEVDVDSAFAHVLNDPASLSLADLGHDAAEGLDEDEAHIGFGQCLVLGDGRADHVLEFGEQLDAGESAADEHEGQGLATLFVVFHQCGIGQAGEKVVAQGDGLFDALERDRVLLQARDRQRTRDRAGGEDDVVVVELERFIVLRFDGGELLGVVDRGDLRGDDLGTRQVAAQRHHSVTGLDRTGCHLGEERQVGHVRVGVDHGDGGFTPAEVLQQILGGEQADRAATDDEDSWTQF